MAAPNLPKPPAKELAAIKARAVAAGFKPTAAAVLATYNRDAARREEMERAFEALGRVPN